MKKLFFVLFLTMLPFVAYAADTATFTPTATSTPTVTATPFVSLVYSNDFSDSSPPSNWTQYKTVNSNSFTCSGGVGNLIVGDAGTTGEARWRYDGGYSWHTPYKLKFTIVDTFGNTECYFSATVLKSSDTTIQATFLKPRGTGVSSIVGTAGYTWMYSYQIPFVLTVGDEYEFIVNDDGPDGVPRIQVLRNSILVLDSYQTAGSMGLIGTIGFLASTGYWGGIWGIGQWTYVLDDVSVTLFSWTPFLSTAPIIKRRNFWKSTFSLEE